MGESMVGMMSGAVFLGRDAELDAVRSVIARAESGEGGVLAVHGEAGVGKTSLLCQAVTSVTSGPAARISAIESESDLQFAGLQMLLTPFLDDLPELPEPQRRALSTAFGLENGPRPQRFLIGLATLSLLAQAAARQTVVCVVDDAQWLDRESADALAFVARRIASDRIALLIGIRASDRSESLFTGIPTLQLRGLPASIARDLLGDRRIDAAVADRLVSGTGGNPLALLELTRELSADQLSGAAALPDPLPVGRRLEDVYRERVRAVPPATQTLLLVAAAETSGDADLVWRAAERLGSPRAAAVPAEDRGFLVLGQGVEFRHPLMRSAVYHGARAAERRRVHEALAAVDDVPERRVWHRALAAVRPDEEIAAELERSAGRAGARGGYAATARLLGRAVELTADESRRGARLLAAARATLETGNLSGAEAMLEQVTPLLPAGPQRAGRLRMLATIRFAQGQVRQTLPLLLEASHMLLPHDERQARDTLFEALEVATWSGKDAMLRVARTLRALGSVAPDTASPTDLLAEALTARLLDGYDSAYPLYRLSTQRLLDNDDLRGFNLGVIAASEMWDLDQQLALTSRWVELAQARGAYSALSLALLLRALSELWRGNYPAVREFGQAATDLSDLTTRQQGRTGSGIELLYAMTGPEEAVRDAAQAHIREATALGREHYGTLVPELALCQLEVALGNYPAALTHGLRVFAADAPGPTCANVLPELIEAAQRSGDTTTAQTALGRLRTAATASGTPTALGLLARSRALLAADDEAEALYVEAIGLLEASPARPQAARAHLVHGEWLRRRRRRREARESLRTAHAMFEAMGAEFYARRARVELAATGERMRRRPVDTVEQLTPQEARIARLASSGVPNREIAAQLFISPSTVEYHLRKTFRKLGVTSRGQLRDALEATGDLKDSGGGEPALR
ncbi:AAA family ATPase [Streptomyces sp. NPDC047081]|uniref:helix-turn-helix transcriptional regulator n=1 Tax=Streptomyces sp. NPDC047081 TaxID=3154706 RepID=UPI0033E86651